MPEASAIAHAPAHAKINLALAVAPPDGSGMHPIASWFAPIVLADDVTITTRDAPPERPLVIEWADDAPIPAELRAAIDWPAEDDLAMKALRALEQRTGDPLHAEIRIAKRIPAGAGLAGGSSNAATTLRLLNQLYELDLSPEDLRETAAALGSDIAFFIDDRDDLAAPPRAALVTGLGDRIERLPLSETHLALIVPDFPCPTGAVYRAFDELDEPHPFDPAAVEAMARAGAPDGEQLFNDLAEAAERVEFVLGSIRSRATQITGAPAHVTGSGSALFIVCENDRDARARAAAASAELTGCAAFATRTV